MKIHDLEVTGSLIYNGVNLLSLTSSVTDSGSFSAQIVNLNQVSSSLNSFTSSINTTIKNKLDSESVISGSAQVLITGTTGYSTFSSSISNSIGDLSSSVGSLSSSIATTTSNLSSRIGSVETKTGSYATTGSNIFVGSQVITGSLYITNDMVVQGCSCLQNITASAVSIGTNTVVLNTATPAVRFAGVSVQDSGSNAGVTGSIYWDGLCNRWVYSNPSGIGYSGGMLLSGPRTSTLGSEAPLTCNYLAKSGGGDHLYDSCIQEVSGSVTIDGTLCTSGVVCGASGIFSSTSYSNLYLDGTNATGWGNNISFRSQGTDFGYVGSVGSLVGNTTKDMTIWSTTGNGFRVYTNGNNPRLCIDSNGISTFACGVTATQFNVSTSGGATQIYNTGGGHTVITNATANKDMNYQTSGTGGHYFNTAGADRLTIASTGAATFAISVNKRISTYTPSSWTGISDYVCNGVGFQFTRPNDDAFTHAIFSFNGASTNNLAISSRSDLVIATGGGLGSADERMRITSGGNAYIGATTGTYPTYGYMLGIRAPSGTQTYISITAPGDTLDDKGLVIGVDTNAAAFYMRDSKYMSFYTCNTERLRITSSGDINMTTASGSKLVTIKGATGNGNYGELRLGNADHSAGIRGCHISSGNVDLEFWTEAYSAGGYQKRMTITSGGQVNVNSTQTTYPFYVQSAIGNWATVIENTANGGSGILMRSTGGSQGFYYGAYDGAGYKFYVSGGGGVHSTSTSITIISSDAKLKTDIRDYNKGLAEVLAMKPRIYKRKDNLEIDEVGFIAQEMDIALAGSMIESYKDEEGEPIHTYQLEWYPLLVKAIQEQQSTICSQSQKIAILESCLGIM